VKGLNFKLAPRCACCKGDESQESQKCKSQKRKSPNRKNANRYLVLEKRKPTRLLRLTGEMM
jgi:hypothetical protein